MKKSTQAQTLAMSNWAWYTKHIHALLTQCKRWDRAKRLPKKRTERKGRTDKPCVAHRQKQRAGRGDQGQHGMPRSEHSFASSLESNCPYAMLGKQNVQVERGGAGESKRGAAALLPSREAAALALGFTQTTTLQNVTGQAGKGGDPICLSVCLSVFEVIKLTAHCNH